MKTLVEIKHKFKNDIDWEWGTYFAHHTNNITYLIHENEDNIQVYHVLPDSVSWARTYKNKTVKEVKEMLG
jgi:hypothetical protein